jgi:lysophospholipase L1-like esterase
MKAFDTIPRKTATTILALAIVAVPQAIRSARLVVTGSPPARPVAASGKPLFAASAQPSVQPAFLDVPAGSLDTFYDALRRTEKKEPGAVTRILHYGDSPTTADSITSDIRRLLQARFGNAGHGFLLIAKPWAWYGHAGMELEASGWKIEPASQSRARDGIHGLGGVSFRGSAGATSRVTLSDDTHTSATVYYLAQPDGGDFSVRAGEADPVIVHTADPDKRMAFAEVPLAAATRTVHLTVASGSVRLFGYRFDKDQPGVQYSSLGINGAQVEMVARYFEARQWTDALQHENPDLVVLNYGTNESIYPAYVEKQYPDELRTVIGRIRAAVPHASLLVMSPMDRGEMKASGEILTPPAMEKLIEQQRRIAAETGCAFFNTFEAMGGAGTMARWYEARPRLVSADFMHPLPAGAAIVGGLFESALVRSYEQAQGAALTLAK